MRIGGWLVFRRYPVLRRVVVNTKTGKTFAGYLWRRRWGLLVLKRAELIAPGGAVSPLDGDLVVPASNVDFLQVVT